VRTLPLMLLLSLGCGPKDVIPTAPTHPANPEAPAPPERPPQAQPTPVPDAGAAPAPDPHAGQERDGADQNAAIAAAETAAYARAKPIFALYCAKCHSSSGKKATHAKLAHLSIDAYPFGGHHATVIGTTIREVLGVTGKKPTMPMDAPGRVKGAELEAILDWSKAFDRAHAAGLHDHTGHAGHGDHH
jgi:hypothetical protein